MTSAPTTIWKIEKKFLFWCKQKWYWLVTIICWDGLSKISEVRIMVLWTYKSIKIRTSWTLQEILNRSVVNPWTTWMVCRMWVLTWNSNRQDNVFDLRKTVDLSHQMNSSCLQDANYDDIIYNSHLIKQKCEAWHDWDIRQKALPASLEVRRKSAGYPTSSSQKSGTPCVLGREVFSFPFQFHCNYRTGWNVVCGE